MNSRSDTKQRRAEEERQRYRRRRIIEWVVAFAVGIAATLVSQELVGL